MRKLWLIFAQTVTIALAAYFVVATLRPDWLGHRTTVVSLRESGGGDHAPAPANSFRDAARQALPAVVYIYTSQEIKRPRHPLLDDPIFRHFFGDRPDVPAQRSSGLGSGVIVSSNGYILTNNHVVEGADAIEIALADTRKFRARVVGSDPESDLAVLQIRPGPNETLPSITFGLMENVRVGDSVLAIG
ncbi:MAG: hypothetical protein RIR00_2666, partial [Pseudomonadota bacterium]